MKTSLNLEQMRKIYEASINIVDFNSKLSTFQRQIKNNVLKLAINIEL
jgi:hypothetical protein